MTDMSIDEYLAHGGKLTSQGNVPARYRGELLSLIHISEPTRPY